MAPSSSKLYPRVAHKKYAPLQWHLPPLNLPLGWLTKGTHRWNGTSSKFYHWVAHKRYAPLECHLPPLNFTIWLTNLAPLERHLPPLNGSQKVRTIEMAPSFSKLLPRMAHNVYDIFLAKFDPRVADKKHSCNGASKFYPRVAHKRHAPLECHFQI